MVFGFTLWAVEFYPILTDDSHWQGIILGFVIRTQSIKLTVQNIINKISGDVVVAQKTWFILMLNRIYTMYSKFSCLFGGQNKMVS